MNGWTKKRKVDTFMGILLQVYCFFPWMRINRKWNTIHMYVIKTFQENDYIKMYNHTFLKQHMWKWKHSQVVAFIFLLMLIFLILLQSIELYKLYQCIKNGNQSTNYHVFVWITYLAAFYIFMAIASTGFAEFYSIIKFFLCFKQFRRYIYDLMYNFCITIKSRFFINRVSCNFFPVRSISYF